MKDEKKRVKSIKELIKMLKEEGVSEFQDGELKLVFSKKPEQIPQLKQENSNTNRAPLEIVTAEEIFNREFEELTKLRRGNNGNAIL
jgi:hypothetical protein